MPRNLVPCENYCNKCPGKVPLSDPIVTSNKAKIVTIAEVVESRLQSMIVIVFAVFKFHA